MSGPGRSGPVIRTPDQRLRVFVSSTLGELRAEREAVRRSVESLRLTPVMFELGARPHPPRELYRAYLDQSHVFLGVYGSRYGWVAPGETVSGLEDEYRLAGSRPRLLYIKSPAPDREPRLAELIAGFADDDQASYKRYGSVEELAGLVRDDLALLLSESFESARSSRLGTDGVPVSGAGGTIPAPVTELVGREQLVDEVVALLGRGRLVTLTGPGGIGKTRVATEVARRAHESGTEAVFVPLAESTDEDRALRTVVEAVGAHVEGESTLLDAVAGRLGERRVLLCLDNLEQIAGAPALVDMLLRAMPLLSVLATSRRALRTQAEHEVRVEPLAVPDPADPPSVAAESAAVRLFATRAQGVGAPAPAAGDTGTVAEITRRLDGLPLAIELAAARTRILSPRAILERLEDHVGVLAGGSPDLPERQRTLRATLDWSHELLEPDERALFARLGVFADGWTLEAAEAVCGGRDVPTGLAGLLDKSLVAGRYSSSAGLEPRFAMLGTVRAYALHRLEGTGEADEVRLRHLAYFRRLGERAQPSLCGPGQRDWLARLDPERANLREAVAWALAHGRHADVVELTWDVVVHYFVRDAVDEPHSWLSRVIASEPELDEVTTAKHESILALTRIHHGDYTDVRRMLWRPLEVFRRQGMDFEAAVTLHQIGFVRFSEDHDAAGAVAALTESAALFDRLGHDWGVSLAEAMQGSVYAALGAPDDARRHLAVALRRAQDIDCEPQQVQALVQLALVEVADHRADRALAYLRQSAGPLRHGHYLNDTATCLVAAAALALEDGQGALAQDAVAVAADVRHRLGISPWPTLARFIAAVEDRSGAGQASPGPRHRDPFDLLDSLLDMVDAR